jgi:hypothetical protein
MASIFLPFLILYATWCHQKNNTMLHMEANQITNFIILKKKYPPYQSQTFNSELNKRPPGHVPTTLDCIPQSTNLEQSSGYG